eukprot:6187264-Pleurochrysis_carterae.AAC.8
MASPCTAQSSCARSCAADPHVRAARAAHYSPAGSQSCKSNHAVSVGIHAGMPSPCLSDALKRTFSVGRRRVEAYPAGK